VLLVVNTPGGLDKIMSNSVKLGADVSLAIGPVGAGAQAATTTNVGADITAEGRLHRRRRGRTRGPARPQCERHLLRADVVR
jgi:hypothetical protein